MDRLAFTPNSVVPDIYGAHYDSSNQKAGLQPMINGMPRQLSITRFTDPTLAARIEQEAAAAAEAAATAAYASFVPQPPQTVPLAHLWPYSALPIPPHPVPDDTAGRGTLSTASLLQQLEHRYLRNEIYTYAAHVLLAVNPYKPLPHLYSTQQILLYRHWREGARAYRVQLNGDQNDTSGERVLQRSSTSSSEAVRSILSCPRDMLPLLSPSTERPLTGSNGAADMQSDGTDVAPWSWNNASEAGGTASIVEEVDEVAASAAVHAFKESTARQNRPPPHPFVVAEEALRRLVGTQTSQTIVVSGQSGAGKTETSKQLMLFLTHASTSPDTSHGAAVGTAEGSLHKSGALTTVSGQRTKVAALLGGVQTLQEAAELRRSIISCNAIFESFGNAATRRNHNSSRIGRLTLLHFDSGGLLRGGSLRTYLLEAARITAHKRGDRNFHVFYQLLRGNNTAHTAAAFQIIRTRFDGWSSHIAGLRGMGEHKHFGSVLLMASWWLCLPS